MRRRPRSVAALAVAVAMSSLVSTTATSIARADLGAGCDGGAACADDDRDGFMACGCAGAGVACDCDNHDPLAFPGAPERCDATKDLNCDGVVKIDCGDKAGCLRGMCVQECVYLDDFGCGVGNHCESLPDGQRLCAGLDCTAFGCLPGFTCDDKKECVADCTPDVKCPFGQLCRGTNCADPCAGVTCAAGSVCSKGQCIASCDCAPGSTGCASGEACDRSLPVPRCVEEKCAGVVCAAGSHCAGGACVDDCAGVVCPPKLVCQHVTTNGAGEHGACVDLCPPATCSVPMVCDWRTGGCNPPQYAEAGLQPVFDTDGGDDGLYAGGAGLTCTTTSALGLGRVSAAGGGFAAALSIVALIARRVRRRRRRD